MQGRNEFRHEILTSCMEVTARNCSEILTVGLTSWLSVMIESRNIVYFCGTLIRTSLFMSASKVDNQILRQSIVLKIGGEIRSDPENGNRESKTEMFCCVNFCNMQW
jgi:hypothetical protein